MGAKPFTWNVIIIGAWNRAILTPNGISKRLLKLTDKTPVQVAVAMDGLAPCKIKHNQLIVMVDDNLLEIATEDTDFTTMAKAMEIGRNALESLPETPIVAGGYNIRYKFDSIEDEILDLIKTPIDSALSKAQYTFTTRQIKRTIVFGKGLINLTLSYNSNKGTTSVEFNFHCNSKKHAELIEWFSIKEADLKETISNLMSKVIGVNMEEIKNE